MFNLIVAVISIALIAAMALASIFYGGDGFSKSTARAEAATLIGQAQQIAGAAALFRIDNSGSNVASTQPSCDSGTSSDCAINRLSAGGYLQAIPSAPSGVHYQDEFFTASWAVADDGSAAFLILTAQEGVADSVCAEVELQGGGAKLPGFMANEAGNAYTAEKFEFDSIEQLYRCADIDIGGGNALTVFGYRL
jgi:type II secretory pathway pseudopilin PulG